VRNSQDFLYEEQQAEVNRRLSGVDTIFLPTRPELACISSSMVRELAHFGRDIAPFLPQGLRYR
jgi:pantetheine-phosphate adenylyltransferase